MKKEKQFPDDGKLREFVTHRLDYKEWLKVVLQTKRIMTKKGLELQKGQNKEMDKNKDKYNKLSPHEFLKPYLVIKAKIITCDMVSNAH